jgi:23S rRNA (cytosine1962-C5)-methyltransferase/23S rRNA (guanine2445-N2)-methyltransferase / 23S rRNA (guanine2069-N7)-methyltransferase
MSNFTEKKQALLNRIKKNLVRLKPMLKKYNTNAFRLYDKDIPELPFMLDKYDYCVYVTEKGLKYSPSHSKLEWQKKREENQLLIKTVLEELFDTKEEHLFWNSRWKGTQDQRVDLDQEKHHALQVQEGQAIFLVHLGLYRDTGLFLDHRPLRYYLTKKYQGKKALNLFSYTSSIGVQLALAGNHTTNVDMSQTYLDWSKENYTLNKLATTDHAFYKMDLMNEELPRDYKYDVIILDPPSFSQSKKMGETVLDIQLDHEFLIDKYMKHLLPGGTLYFSTNLRDFQMDLNVSDHYLVKNMTKLTIPEDYRDQKIHQCYSVEPRP